ncbi:MAG: PA0069 family radical SAM protein [Alphaproteobacteria bacterium]|nr:PA0069 family radical SAM protein [Alphaproteobacteria bacterium]
MSRNYWGRGKDRLDEGEATALAHAARGRGAVSNAAGRFEPVHRVLSDDGWGVHDAEAPALRTTLIIDATRSIIARNQSPDISFDRSINPYRGCEHGCIYCFARPSHAYLGMSAGLDFESKLFIKPKAAELLAGELSAKGYRVRPIAIGTNTDPYQPIERTHRIMRQVLEVLASFRHPVTIVTKSHLVTRDIDILQPMAKANLARVAVSVTTLDRRLARAMEPRAATPERRLEAIAALSEAGIPTAVMTAPIIPALNDSEMEAILERARDQGARQAGYVILRLPLEIKDLFREWLAAHFPDKAQHVMSLIRQMRGGRDYDADWQRRMTGTGPYASLIAKRFGVAVRRLGLNARLPPLDTSAFRPPHTSRQLDLL